MKNERTVGLRIVSQMVSLSTLGVRDLSCAVSGFDHGRHRSIQPHARKKKNLWYPRLLLFALSTFLSPLIFVLVGYAILKDFSHLLDAKYTDRNCNGDVMTIDQ